MGYLRLLNKATDVVGEKVHSQFLDHLLEPGGYMNGQVLKLKEFYVLPSEGQYRPLFC
jgi:hypothetical protein